ncbi:MAG: DUF4350 domain-containing protein [bacterium]|nr:DUF4350 domain-containing protein [bacterium]
MKGTTIFWSFVGVLVLGACLYLWFGAEWIEEEVDLGYSAEARRNDFLAAEQFLALHHVDTESTTGMKLLDALPPADDAILMSAAREALSERRRDALVAWVERGGLLMVIAHSTYDYGVEASRDRLLDQLGVFLLPPEIEDEEELEEGVDVDLDQALPSENEEAERSEASADEEDEVVADTPENLGEMLDLFLGTAECREGEDWLDRVDVGVEGREALVELRSENTLAVYEERLEDAYLSPKKQVLSLPVGEGRVVAMTSIHPFRNERIACQDHAWLLWHVFEGRPKVWMLHDPEVPSISDLAFATFPLVSWGGIGLVLVACLTYSLRFELPVRGSAVPRREHLEHVEASVTFHYRKGGFARLMRRLREDLGARAPRDREKWGARAGLPPDAVAEALREDVPRNRRAVVERTRSMLRMRRTK